MTRFSLAAIASLILFFASAASAQLAIDDSPAAVEAGLRVFRSHCSRCHDLNGQGYRGRDLSQLAGRKTTAQLANVISRGIGAEMPATSLTPQQTSRVIAYLRSLGGPAIVETGDARRGENLFWNQYRCGRCHMVAGRGGRLGPDLTHVGAARSKSFLIREVRSPSDYISKGFEPVSVVTESGETVSGVRKNEDAFSLQMLDVSENLRNFLREEVRDVKRLDESFMPVYTRNQLSDADLDDLLRYLAALR